MRNSADDISNCVMQRKAQQRSLGHFCSVRLRAMVRFMFFGWHGFALSLVCLVRCSEGCKSLSMLNLMSFSTMRAKCRKHRNIASSLSSRV